MNEATIVEPRERAGSLLKRAAVLGAVLTAGVSLFGAVKSVVILPYRIEATEKAIGELRGDHDLLLRIEERLKALDEKLDRTIRTTR